MGKEEKGQGGEKKRFSQRPTAAELKGNKWMGSVLDNDLRKNWKSPLIAGFV